MYLSPYDAPLQPPPPFTLASYISSLNDDTEDSPLYSLPQPYQHAFQQPIANAQQSKELVQTLATEEGHFAEATFKPTQLHQLLKSSKK